MTSTEIARTGEPAFLVRVFGWITMLGLLAYLINNFLTVGFDYPGAVSAITGSDATGGWIQLLIYAAAVAGSVLLVMRTPDRALRYEAARITAFNAYLVRACFFAVLFVGIADTTIAFMRVERLLPEVFSDDFSRMMARARDVGFTIHLPLIGLGIVAAFFSRTLGFTWLALLIVVAELAIVISRFVFSYEQALMGDLVRYWYAALFLFASAHTLLEEGHVRVDVFYSAFSPRKKGKVNAIGTILLGMTTCWVIIGIGFAGKQSIINSPVANFEVSQTGVAGMYTKYQMAAFIGIFAITMLIQFVSYLFEAVADKRGEPGGRQIAPVAH